MRYPILSFLCLAALSACNGSSAARHFTVGGVPGITASDKLVLDHRLGADGSLSFLRPATTYAVHDGRLDIRTGASDDAQDLRFLLSHQGRFALTSEWGRPWVDQSGVADVQAALGENGQVLLRVRLTPVAAARLAHFLADTPADTRIAMKFDDETLVEAPLGGHALGADFQVPLGRPMHEAMLIAEVIRSGALSFHPGDVTVESAAGS